MKLIAGSRLRDLVEKRVSIVNSAGLDPFAASGT